jgi:hypothetical protein
MTIFATRAAHQAVYNLLKNDNTLAEALAVSVFSAVPQHSQFPYIVIGDGVQHVQPTEGMLVTECQLDIHIWTAANGHKQALDIMDRIYALLHLGTLTISDFEQVVLRVDRASVTLEEEGNALRGTLRVIAIVVEV